MCGSELEGYNGVQPALSEVAVLRVCPFYCWILVLERKLLEMFFYFGKRGREFDVPVQQAGRRL